MVTVNRERAAERGVPVIPSYPNQPNQNRLESLALQHIASRVIERLTNRSGGRNSPPWTAKQQVRVGVLRPIQREDPQANVGGSVIGVDFVAEAESDADFIALEIDLTFALYHPVWPTREEVLDATRRSNEAAMDEEDPDDNRRAQEASRDLPINEAWVRNEIFIPRVPIRVPTDGSHVGSEGNPIIDQATAANIEDHFSSQDAARPFQSGGRTVTIAALEADQDYAEYLARRTDPDWSPIIPEPRIHVFAEPLPDGGYLVSVSLINETEPRTNDRLQDIALYDAGIEARVLEDATIVEQHFRLAPEDYRYADVRNVIGRGRGCVAIRSGQNGIASETLPIYIQSVVRHRTDHMPDLRWTSLAEEPGPILSQVEDAMRAYQRQWEEYLESLPEEYREASRRDLESFHAESRRFATGRSLIADDSKLARAFRLANRVFSISGAKKGHTSWRPFQLAYIVSLLGSIAVREEPHRSRLASEIQTADVLWFPTGGGKTEAYLGLIVAALFYDRLRGKSRGITSMLRFPLRMLSAQQLDRILRVLVTAEQVKRDEAIQGAEFDLGYLVGGNNTPNQLRYEQNWWPGMANANRLTDEECRRRRLIADCPYCEETDSVKLSPERTSYRLLHVCTSCDATLPVYISDDEVFRYLPAVIVSTVDKVTGFAHFGEFTSITHGPAGRCPDHGYYAFSGCKVESCKRQPREMMQVTDWYDPAPSLIVQDELHLVAEELGAFAAHFESAIAELQRASTSGLPSKILAASATIQGFREQVKHVYGRRPRRFPSPGFERTRDFYTIEEPVIRRIFLGVMPTGGGTSRVEIAGRVQTEFIEAVQDLQDDPEELLAAARECLNEEPSSSELAALLFNYEVSLAYVNRRPDAARIADDLRDLNQAFESSGRDNLRHELLTGDVSISELAAAISDIERARLDDERQSRLRALVGTSVVSHGVDLARLNLLTMTGMPATIADYIQATSRIGRNHAGLVVTVFDHYALREASIFSNFASTHTFLDRLVEQVPVNKYARLAVDRTLSAIVMTLLWDIARDPEFSPPRKGIREVKDFRPWWNRHAAEIRPILERRLRAAYGAHEPEAADPGMEEQLVEWALERWERHELPMLNSFRSRLVKDCFAMPVLTSLRDVDEPVEFGAAGQHHRAFEALT